MYSTTPIITTNNSPTPISLIYPINSPLPVYETTPTPGDPTPEPETSDLGHLGPETDGWGRHLAPRNVLKRGNTVTKWYHRQNKRLGFTNLSPVLRFDLNLTNRMRTNRKDHSSKLTFSNGTTKFRLNVTSRAGNESRPPEGEGVRRQNRRITVLGNTINHRLFIRSKGQSNCSRRRQETVTLRVATSRPLKLRLFNVTGRNRNDNKTRKNTIKRTPLR